MLNKPEKINTKIKAVNKSWLAGYLNENVRRKIRCDWFHRQIFFICCTLSTDSADTHRFVFQHTLTASYLKSINNITQNFSDVTKLQLYHKFKTLNSRNPTLCIQAIKKHTHIQTNTQTNRANRVYKYILTLTHTMQLDYRARLSQLI